MANCVDLDAKCIDTQEYTGRSSFAEAELRGGVVPWMLPPHRPSPWDHAAQSGPDTMDLTIAWRGCVESS
jgi:hypothetical protein